jgi:hypothetical protein
MMSGMGWIRRRLAAEVVWGAVVVVTAIATRTWTSVRRRWASVGSWMSSVLRMGHHVVRMRGWWRMVGMVVARMRIMRRRWRSVGTRASRVSVRRRCVRTPRLPWIRIGIAAIGIVVVAVILARVVVGILGSLFGVVIGTCRSGRAVATAAVVVGSGVGVGVGVAWSSWRRRRLFLAHLGSTLTIFCRCIIVTSSRSSRRTVF